jgi:uncharacterized membrane protein YphA (DoxX/SURF4 family)
VVDEAFSRETWATRALAALRISHRIPVRPARHRQAAGRASRGDVRSPDLVLADRLAGVLELVGGALIVLGLFTRPAAFILSGEMAVAYFMAHASHGNVLLPTLNEGEAAVLYCFVFLFLSVRGLAHGASTR